MDPMGIKMHLVYRFFRIPPLLLYFLDSNLEKVNQLVTGFGSNNLEEGVFLTMEMRWNLRYVGCTSH